MPVFYLLGYLYVYATISKAESRYVQCRILSYAECCYAECRHAERRGIVKLTGLNLINSRSVHMFALCILSK
jgi:hypothetical protein